MQPPSEVASVEQELLSYVRRLERNPYGWRAVHLNLSQLKPQHRRDYQLRIAASEFDGLLRSFNSELFQLRSGDIVYLWEGGDVDAVDQVVLRLRYLFSDDPLVSAGELDGTQDETEAPREGALDDAEAPEPPKQSPFCSWLDLEHGYDAFRYGIEDLVEQLQQGDAPTPPGPAQTLDPTRLGELEAHLAEADLSALVRRQPICAMLPKSAPRPILREVHLAIGELAKRVTPGVDLTADTWLFQHLAETLDRRLLAHLAEHGAGEGEGALSINLRLATLLSPDFLQFDKAFRRHHTSEVVVELQLIDIFAEFGAYLFIREFIRERGYRICIDGLHHLHLPLINRRRLGADLVKLVWSPDLRDDRNATRHRDLEAAVRQTGVDRVILCRCDSSDAIAWGQSLGIRLFQGHYVDSRLRAARSPAVAAAREALRQNRPA